MTESSRTWDDGPYELVTARHGRFLANKNDEYIGRSMIAFGEYSEPEVDLLRQITRPGAHLVEVGANIGAHTVPLARHVGPTGFVCAIEMQPVVFQLLCANLALNGLLNVDAQNLAGGAENGVVPFPEINYSAQGNFGGLGLAHLPTSQSRRSIAIKPLDDLQFPKLDLIKIDVEGAELDVLKGAAKTITTFRPALYLENDRLEKSSALIRHIQAHGYRLWWHMPRLFNPNNWKGQTENPWPGVVSCNMLCLPKEALADIAGLTEIEDPDSHPLRKNGNPG